MVLWYDHCVSIVEGPGLNPTGVGFLNTFFLRIAEKFSLLFASRFLRTPFLNPLFNIRDPNFIEKSLGVSNTKGRGFFF